MNGYSVRLNFISFLSNFLIFLLYLLIEVQLLTVYCGQVILRKIQVLWNMRLNILSMFDHNILALIGNQQTIDRYLFKKIANILSTNGVLSIFQTY